MNLPAPLRVIIVEDLPRTRKYLEDFIHQQPGFAVIGGCATVYEAIILINNTKPDLLLLDIALPDGTGFDILENITVQTKVIFLTAHQEFAIRAIRCGAIDYLLKPIDDNELQEALQKAISPQPLLQEQIAITLQNFRNNKLPDQIALRSQQFVKIVRIKEIRYLQGDNGYTTVFLNDGTKVVTTKNLKEYEELLSGTSFLRTHQSYLVNKFYIDRYHQKQGILYLKDGTHIPVAYRKKEKVGLHFRLFEALIYRIGRM